mgnify:FL=1
MRIVNLHSREKLMITKPTLSTLAIANASRGEITVKITTKLLKQIIREEYSAIHSAGKLRTREDDEYAAQMKAQQDAETERRDRDAKATNDEPEFQTNPELEEGYGRPAYVALTGTYKTEREARKALAQARIDDPKFFENKPEGTYDVAAETIYKVIKAEDMADDFVASTITEKRR